MTSSEPISAPSRARSPWQSAARAFAEVLLPPEAASEAAELAVTAAEWDGAGDDRQAVLDAVWAIVAQHVGSSVPESRLRAAEQAFSSQPADAVGDSEEAPSEKVVVAPPAEPRDGPATTRAFAVDVPPDWLDALSEASVDSGPEVPAERDEVSVEPEELPPPAAELEANVPSEWREALVMAPASVSVAPPLELEIEHTDSDEAAADSAAPIPAPEPPPSEPVPIGVVESETRATPPTPKPAIREFDERRTRRGVVLSAVLIALVAIGGVVVASGVFDLSPERPGGSPARTAAAPPAPPAKTAPRVSPTPNVRGADGERIRKRATRPRRRARSEAPAAPVPSPTANTPGVTEAPAAPVRQAPAPAPPTPTPRPAPQRSEPAPAKPKPAPQQTTPPDTPRPTQPSSEPGRQAPTG